MYQRFDIKVRTSINFRNKLWSVHRNFRAAACNGKRDQAVDFGKNADQACPSILLLVKAGEDSTKERNHGIF